MSDTLRRRLLLAAAALPAACAMPSPGTALPGLYARPARPGERWYYSSRNGYNRVGQSEMMVEMRMELARQVYTWQTSDGVELGAEIVDEQGRLLQDPAYGRPPLRFEDPVPWWPIPPATDVVSMLRTHYRLAGDSARYEWSDYRRIGAPVRIRVPAGEFDCLPIERQIRFAHPDFGRLDPYRHDFTWYAPALGRWVRREWRGFYYIANSRSMSRLDEDWRIWELSAHEAAPVGS